jgi:hypothetical protein
MGRTASAASSPVVAVLAEAGITTPFPIQARDIA